MTAPFQIDHSSDLFNLFQEFFKAPIHASSIKKFEVPIHNPSNKGNNKT